MSETHASLWSCCRSDKNVHFYDDDLNDEKHTTASHHHRTGRVAPPTPSNLSAAEKELEAAKVIYALFICLMRVCELRYVYIIKI